MSIPDELIIRYLTLVTNTSRDEIGIIQQKLNTRGKPSQHQT